MLRRYRDYNFSTSGRSRESSKMWSANVATLRPNVAMLQRLGFSNSFNIATLERRDIIERVNFNFFLQNFLSLRKLPK